MTRSHLTAEERKHVRSLHKRGYSTAAIVRLTGRSKHAVARAKKPQGRATSETTRKAKKPQKCCVCGSTSLFWPDCLACAAEAQKKKARTNHAN